LESTETDNQTPTRPSPPPLGPLPPPADPDTVLDRFVAVMHERGLSLYPAQEEAILELLAGHNVILNTPTGSGKSLVAAAFHFKALCAGERSVYTCPIKALVNEKFLALCRDFGPENVGMMTGDASVNPKAPILCCTAEILANIALSRGDRCDIRAVIMDEFHYYGDRERGYAWQVPLLTMPHARFLLMSATLSSTGIYEDILEKLTGATAVTVSSDERPVPLTFEYTEKPLTEKLQSLIEAGRAPIYLVHFTQRAASEAARDLVNLGVSTRSERDAINREIETFAFNTPYGRELKRLLSHGIGVHHAGLLPKYRVLVEKLAQRGLLKVICGTDTLGMGINVPIRTVVFTQLWKFDGEKSAILSVRDFQQIAGRAGRKGFDDTGHVVAMAPEHVIENKRAEEKAGNDPKKRRKIVRKKPPPGFVSWDEKTFERLRTAPAEMLQSHFDVTHGMLLQVLSRETDGCRAMRQLIADCHESEANKRRLRRKAWQLFRSLLERGIIEFIPPEPSGRKVRVNVELQDDFSLHQELSVFLLDTIPLLDPASPDYPCDLLTLCEAIVEDPGAILRRQVDKLKADKFAELKAAGIEYEERMEKLAEIEHPKPLREFLYTHFNAFAAKHPWVGEENIRPKSIAREMYERYLSFTEYVREYGLERMEGLLLRHLSQVWKVLAQTVPDTVKTEPVLEMELYLRELIRGIDSSLLEEWERMLHPELALESGGEDAAPAKPRPPSSRDITRDPHGFRREIRTAVFAVLQAVLLRDWETAASRLDNNTPAEIENAFAPYFEARQRFRLDPAGRAAANSHWHEDREGGTLTLAQVLVDAEELSDWEAVFSIDLSRSRSEQRPVLRLETVHPIGGV